MQICLFYDGEIIIIRKASVPVFRAIMALLQQRCPYMHNNGRRTLCILTFISHHLHGYGLWKRYLLRRPDGIINLDIQTSDKTVPASLVFFFIYISLSLRNLESFALNSYLLLHFMLHKSKTLSFLLLKLSTFQRWPLSSISNLVAVAYLSNFYFTQIYKFYPARISRQAL